MDLGSGIKSGNRGKILLLNNGGMSLGLATDDKRQGVQVSQYCIPLYVSYDGKPSDRAFAGPLAFFGQE